MTWTWTLSRSRNTTAGACRWPAQAFVRIEKTFSRRHKRRVAVVEVPNLPAAWHWGFPPTAWQRAARRSTRLVHRPRDHLKPAAGCTWARSHIHHDVWSSERASWSTRRAMDTSGPRGARRRGPWQAGAARSGGGGCLPRGTRSGPRTGAYRGDCRCAEPLWPVGADSLPRRCIRRGCAVLQGRIARDHRRSRDRNRAGSAVEPLAKRFARFRATGCAGGVGADLPAGLEARSGVTVDRHRGRADRARAWTDPYDCYQ
jgi:hypothetical protein